MDGGPGSRYRLTMTSPGPSIHGARVTCVRRGVAARALAWGVAAFALVLAAVQVVLGVVNLGSGLSFMAAGPIWAVFPISYALMGGLVASQRRENPIGWLFLFVAVVGGLSWAASEYGLFAAIAHPGSLPGAAWAVWFYNVFQILVYPSGALVLTLLLLPDGRLPSRRWRPVVVAAVTFTLAFTLLSAFVPAPEAGPDGQTLTANPVGLPALRWFAQNGSPVVNAAFVVGGLILLVAAAAPLLRARRARGEEREQVRWIAYVVLMTAAANAVTASLFVVAPSFQSAWNVLIGLVNVVGFGVGLPVAAAIAIFKYRLYDIDLIISRTLVYGSLAAFITAVYVAIAVGVGSLVGSGGQPNLGLSILATAIVAVGFQPVRERVQRLANRLVYGTRASPYEVLSEFSERVAESPAADDVLPRMARVLAEGTGADHAQVWLRVEGVLRPAATWPERIEPDGAPGRRLSVVGQLLPAIPESDRAVAVRHQGELLGALSVRKRRGESLTPIEEKLLDDLANQAGLVLKNVGLTAELLQRLDELRASRQRLVAAQDEARRRLERNLHDGAQQHMVALKVKLGLAGALARKDPARARELVGQLAADADEALQTLRDLARGIYPPLLADSGLAAALEAQARRATLPVVAEADGVGRHPREVEAAVYFCVLEALQNVQKYAAAGRATIRLSNRDGRLAFEVEDDGRGFDPATVRRGSGLNNIADRLDALGGGLQIESAPGRGTRLRGTVPAVAAVRATA
jgi:signal transduction histidine kinase